jgi:hypothetical protein
MGGGHGMRAAKGTFPFVRGSVLLAGEACYDRAGRYDAEQARFLAIVWGALSCGNASV